MSDVIFAIDNGDDLMARNEFVQRMIRNRIVFRQCIGSYMMENADDGSDPTPTVEYSYRINRIDYNRIQLWEDNPTKGQESVLIINRDQSCELMYMATKDKPERRYSGLGAWTAVSEERAKDEDDWTFDLGKQQYYICVIPAVTLEDLWDAYAAAHRDMMYGYFQPDMTTCPTFNRLAEAQRSSFAAWKEMRVSS